MENTLTSLDYKYTKDITDEDWIVMLCDSIEESKECAMDKSIIWPIIEIAIKRMLDENRESIIALEIRNLEVFGSEWITIKRDNIQTILNKMLKWREGRLEYEECSNIVKLLEKTKIDKKNKNK